MFLVNGIGKQLILRPVTQSHNVRMDHERSKFPFHEFSPRMSHAHARLMMRRPKPSTGERRESGLSGRDGIRTIFDYFDADEEGLCEKRRS
jgi:hypothetical protein